ncbi:hypothetical protein CTI12_AA497600 [Artemisia annua]|uniref:Uncharacterized protein n=1 Tax=Artemisia annua TaxID=35608 RepID=A0A2U1LFI5_ARTAN|nr:hypothetical protein CTI12_AA497600 [Artemisia annua]
MDHERVQEVKKFLYGMTRLDLLTYVVKTLYQKFRGKNIINLEVETHVSPVRNYDKLVADNIRLVQRMGIHKFTKEFVGVEDDAGVGLIVTALDKVLDSKERKKIIKTSLRNVRDNKNNKELEEEDLDYFDKDMNENYLFSIMTLIEERNVDSKNVAARIRSRFRLLLY